MSTPSSRATRRTSRLSNRAALPDGAQIPQRTVCLVTELKRVGNRKKVNSAAIEVDADRASISVSKALLEAPQLQNIVNLDTGIRRMVNASCLPSFFRAGVFLCPLVSVEQVEARLQELQSERQELVEIFLAEYPRLVEQSRTRLRGLFNALDYPAVEAVRQEFGFAWQYMAFDVPATLQAIDQEIFAREREKQQRLWNEAASQIQMLLRANMLDLVGNMTQKLAPSSDGQRKIFRNSMVANLTDFLRNFDARNITDDVELARIVAQARDLLDGVDPQLLRDSDSMRATVQSGFAQVQQELGAMITNRPARRIVLSATAGSAAGSATAAAQQSVQVAQPIAA